MKTSTLQRAFSYFCAAVWIGNGLCCKILDLVHRHELIVARILGPEHSRTITILIGTSEVAMAIWILSGIRRRMNAVAQILVIATMNTLEFFLASDLLLWGNYNAVFALMFIIAIYIIEWHPEVISDRQ